LHADKLDAFSMSLGCQESEAPESKTVARQMAKGRNGQHRTNVGGEVQRKARLFPMAACNPERNV
jgi:hypothetical protein